MSAMLLETPRAEVPLPVGELARLTVAQYHRMLGARILEDGAPVELLGGLLVRKIRGEGMTISPAHQLVVNRLMRLAPRCEAAGAHLRLQAPLTIPDHDEPEPDGAIAAGAPEDYGDRHPGPAEVSCVVEVADSSLERDRSLKLALYARGGIPQYLLVNLVDRCLEVYQEPLAREGRYRSLRTVSAGERIALLLPDGSTLDLAADDILP